MILFATAIVDPEAYRRYARPGIERVAEPDSEILAIASVGTPARSGNLLLDLASRHDDLEALVLVDQDLELTDARFCATIRETFGDPDVAVAGCLGARGVRSVAWWEGEVSAAPIVHRYHDFGGGELRGFPWKPAAPPPADVDAVEGDLLVVSPWAVRNLRFDEGFPLGHGWDVDFCLQARAAGRKVVTRDMRAIRYRSLSLVGEYDKWIEAHVHFAQKWDGRVPGAETQDVDWKQRARRSEAEREVARTLVYLNLALVDTQLPPLEEAMQRATSTLSWRVTAPLRRANHVVRLARRRRLGQGAADLVLRDRRLGRRHPGADA